MDNLTTVLIADNTEEFCASLTAAQIISAPLMQKIIIAGFDAFFVIITSTIYNAAKIKKHTEQKIEEPFIGFNISLYKESFFA